MGFVNTDTLPTHQAPAKKPVSAKLGTAETQLNIPEFGRAELSTYNRELAGHGIHSPDDKALDKAANQADIQRIIDKGLSTAKPVQKTSQKPSAEGMAETLSKPSADGQNGLYGDWVKAVQKKQCRPSVRETWLWIQKRISNKETGSRTHDRTRITTMQKAFFSRAISDGLMKQNPNYRNGGKKYIWTGA
jgi:hypothetical protein